MKNPRLFPVEERKILFSEKNVDCESDPCSSCSNSSSDDYHLGKSTKRPRALGSFAGSVTHSKGAFPRLGLSLSSSDSYCSSSTTGDEDSSKKKSRLRGLRRRAAKLISRGSVDRSMVSSSISNVPSPATAQSSMSMNKSIFHKDTNRLEVIPDLINENEDKSPSIDSIRCRTSTMPIQEVPSLIPLRKWRNDLSKLPIVHEEDDCANPTHNNTDVCDEESNQSCFNDILSHSTSESLGDILKNTSGTKTVENDTERTFQTQSMSSLDSDSFISRDSEEKRERKHFSSWDSNNCGTQGKQVELELADRLKVILVLKDVILQQRKTIKSSSQENNKLKHRLLSYSKTMRGMHNHHVEDKHQILKLQSEVSLLKEKLHSFTFELKEAKENCYHWATCDQHSKVLLS